MSITRLLWLALSLAVASVVAGPIHASGVVPVLGHPWGVGQQGYGHAAPPIISNGGDPTGLVTGIRWMHWGAARATGYGTSTYVWPGTSVANNGPVKGAEIVAFRLGTCSGHPAYNAVEWFFPRYGQAFDPRHYINACTGAYEGAAPKVAKCANLTVGTRTATQVLVTGMSCTAARALIARSPAARFVPPHRTFVSRFTQDGFRCGTAGDGRDASTPLSYECVRGGRSFLFDLSVS